MTAATVYEQIAAYYCAIMHAVKVSSHKSCIITTLLSRRSNGMTLAAMSGFEPGPPMDVRMAEWSKAPDSRLCLASYIGSQCENSGPLMWAWV